LSEQRKEIRKKIVSLLKRGKTDAGDNVVGNRVNPPWKENLPCISVYTRGELLEEWTQAPRVMKATLQVGVEVVAKGRGEEELGNRVDELCEQVEVILAKDDSLEGTVEDIILRSINFDWEPSGEKMMSSATLMWDVVYLRSMPRDRFDQEQKDFETATAEWDLNSEQDEDDRADDTINVPTT